jgi:hypothetical protein
MAGQATFSVDEDDLLDEDDLDEAVAGSGFFADFSADPLPEDESVEVLAEPESLDCLSFFSDFSDASEEDPFLLSVW